jgi:hypothetical protein
VAGAMSWQATQEGWSAYCASSGGLASPLQAICCCRHTELEAVGSSAAHCSGSDTGQVGGEGWLPGEVRRASSQRLHEGCEGAELQVGCVMPYGGRRGGDSQAGDTPRGGGVCVRGGGGGGGGGGGHTRETKVF